MDNIDTFSKLENYKANFAILRVGDSPHFVSEIGLLRRKFERLGQKSLQYF